MMDHRHGRTAGVAVFDNSSSTTSGGSATPRKSSVAGASPSAGAAAHTRSRLRTEVDATRWPDGDEDTCSLAARDSDSCDAPGKPLAHISSGALKKSRVPARRRHNWRRVVLLVTPALLLLVVWLQFFIVFSAASEALKPPLPQSSSLPLPVLPINGTLALHRTFSVVVHHGSALQRLTPAHRVRVGGDAGNSGEARLSLSQLPSWTLRVVNDSCATCFDTPTYGTAVAGMLVDMRNGGKNKTQKKPAPLPVFATTSAPLGLTGPLLFAMASVTDDVDVAAELRRWPWVTRSYAQLRTGAYSGAPRHLMVMGIPSTDQPKRYPLRDGQRATWMTYREVARAENDFTGALLPLYVFAAAERDSDGQSSSGTLDMGQLTPTVGEYVAASAQRRGTNSVPVEYEQRRVVLREGWRDIPRSDAAVWESPCAAVKTSVMRAGSVEATLSPLVQLSSALALPVTPAFTAAARYICHASTALWQEALRHRNSVWIDMLTDRKPTTAKTIGMGISWGMPTEVGMGQKTMLWLNYAYTAFPDVPYIMKSDDDTYMKVPQYLSDLRYARGGVRRARNLTSEIPHGGVVPVTQALHDDGECLYRTWRLHAYGVVYGNGAGYTLDRRLIQASTNLFDQSHAVMLQLVTMPYNSSLDEAYRNHTIQVEDVMVGRQVKDHAAALRNTCPKRRVCYLSDKRSRAHQVLRPPQRRVTWASTMEHYGMPAIPYYMHYFHKNEFRVAAEAKVALAHGADISDVEANATAHMHDWVRSQVPSTLVGLNSELDVDWVRGPKRVAYVVAEEDDVAVYDVRYRFHQRKGAECTFESVN
ncbi:phosphoglycan beta 1,3 galactosyltransferase 4 [Novymonas esmeraldas]|uniref:Phosphoglycan beta 1,3 galactosyltransferase 4 n=1 Tax=Novymonas esmeraldas TaxID=1808958 RepID=A0AAW0EQ41_9TRYP